ncbi:MAG: bifunctional 3,4-dihydroxy-2-butanone-4-phosphate synthase/GTP cyclohydrolase II [Candidatus Omnitrophica bacterium]|nr:bifunctional 3,4-dihydroxy-2-butanone-4-phosphate synthase/GTP cyclohydrolase II [Candidatus Omnitrophota bacterium]
MEFSSIKYILEDFREGKLVILTDDESRENEGDLITAASLITPEKINFMAKYGRGLICVPIAEDRLGALGLKDMARENEGPFRTAFTVSVDARLGVTTGISAFDRARTIEVLVDGRSGPRDIVTPGHVFPLRAKRGGVLVRAGHTEAAVDLARLAGLVPAGVICEIMNEDGHMARTPELLQFAQRHGLKIGTIASLIEYRRRFDQLVERLSEATLPTRHGSWNVILYRSILDGLEHVAMVKGELNDEPCLVRVHSECFTGEVLGSLRCDCAEQLDRAMQRINEEGKGVLLYMRQEGRGIGLSNKLKAYSLQEQGLDTVEANEKLGFKPDLRDYGIGAQILCNLGLRRIRLLTNNPRKIVGLEGYGLEIAERIPLQVPPHEGNENYLRTKKEKLGHLLDL